MSVLFLCKLIRLNIWVAKLKRRLCYVFVLYIFRRKRYEDNLRFTRLNNFGNDSKKKIRNLQGSFMAVYFATNFVSFFRLIVI